MEEATRKTEHEADPQAKPAKPQASTSSGVVVVTTPHDTASIPSWIAELAMIAGVLEQRRIPNTIKSHVRLARGRAGVYDVLDFVWLLMAYASSGEPTLKDFWERLTPFADPVMALLDRQRVPHRSTLSRFLQAMTLPCVESLRRVMEQDLRSHGLTGESMGGVWGHQGERWVVLDLDGTRQVARQRAVTRDPAYPPPRRRFDHVCAPGYGGRKRGETVRSRVTVQQAHTQEWLGTFAGAGSGKLMPTLQDGLRVIGDYLDSREMDRTHGIVRIDGQYGKAAFLAPIQQAGMGFVVRCADHRLLQHAQIQAVIQSSTATPYQSPDSPTTHEVFDGGFLTDWYPEKALEPVRCRVIVMRHPVPSSTISVRVGKLVKAEGQVYELFVTTLPAASFTATEVVRLYHHRGSFEQVLADEDQEQEMDRWCSHTAEGQTFWQILSQWVWNIRIALGHQERGSAVRWTIWDSPSPDSPSDVPSPGSPPMPSPSSDSGVSPVADEPTTPSESSDDHPPDAPRESLPAPLPSPDSEALPSPSAEAPPESSISAPTEPSGTTDSEDSVGGGIAGRTVRFPLLVLVPCVLWVAHQIIGCPPPPPDDPDHPSGRRWFRRRTNPAPSPSDDPLSDDGPAPTPGPSDSDSVPDPDPDPAPGAKAEAPSEAAHGAMDEAHQGPADEPDPSPASSMDSDDDPAPTFGRRVLDLAHVPHGRYTGDDFTPQADGTLRCPAGHSLAPQKRTVLPNGDEQVRFVAHVPDCRGCDHRAACLTPQSVSPRSVQGTYRVIPTPLDVGSLPDGATDPPVFRHAAIWWCDLGGRAVRRDFVAHLRRQQVTITVIPGEAPAPSNEPAPWIITSNQRAHRRLRWSERFLRNARPASAPRYCFHITGVSPALTAAIGGIVKSP